VKSGLDEFWKLDVKRKIMNLDFNARADTRVVGDLDALFVEKFKI
jgi:hypothetical protein